jgi:hypothetical protein
VALQKRVALQGEGYMYDAFARRLGKGFCKDMGYMIWVLYAPIVSLSQAVCFGMSVGILDTAYLWFFLGLLSMSLSPGHILPPLFK